MGVSTDAVLFYGFGLEDEYGDEVGDIDWFFSDDSDACVYIDEEVLVRTGKSCKEWDVEFGFHCHIDAPIWYICVAGVTSNRGFATEITAATLKVGEDWDSRLKDFCDAMGIKYKQPAWWLVSYWG